MKGKTNKMIKMAMLAALSVVLMILIRFPIIPAATFLEYEPADIPMLIGGFMYGPLAGLIIVIVGALIQALTVSAQSGWVGFVMHVIASGTFVVISAIIYKNFHTKKGALLSLIIGALAMTAVMVPANLFFTVKFWGYPLEAVKSLLLPGIIPFNLLKSGINLVIVMLIYKPISKLFIKI
jgi:riboflavin transporter FmnP